MSGKGGFAVTVSLVDGASKQIDAINKKIAAMSAPAQRVQRSLSKFADASGLAAVGRGFQGVARASLQAFENIGRMIGPLGAITSALSVAGIVKLTLAFAAMGAKLEYTSQRLGITSGQLDALQGAARLGGASADALTSGMKTLSTTLVDAVGGRAPEAVGMLNALGISMRDRVTGGARKAIDVLPELADKIAKMTDPTLQAEAATVLLGGAAEELLPFLRRGSAGIAEWTTLARKYGVVNEEAARQAVVMERAQTELSLSVEGLQKAIGAKLAPVLAPLLTQVANWISLNRAWIATGITDAVSQLADYLRSINWADVGNSMGVWAKRAKDVADSFGGVGSAAKVLLGFMGTVWIAGMLAPIAQLAAAMAALGLLGPAAIAGLAAAGIAIGLRGAQRGAESTATMGQGGYEPAAVDDNGNAIGYVNKTTGDYQPDLESARRAHPEAFAPQVGPANPGASTRGIRNNNPLNLSYVPGQQGVLGPESGANHQFGVYGTMAAGIAAEIRQLAAYQDQGLKTVRQMVMRWAPDAQAGYVNDVAAAIGTGPDQPVNIRDSRVAAAYIRAAARHESAAVPESDIAQGVAAALGGPVAVGPPVNVGGGAGSPAATTTTIRGTANVNINLRGQPPGTTTTATTSGDLFAPPQIGMSGVGR